MSATSPLSQAKRELLARRLNESNIDRLAQALRRQSIPRREPAPVTAFHSEGCKRPFIFLPHDVMGAPIWSMNLASAMSEDQPVYLLNPPKLDGPTAPTMEAFAAKHIEVVREMQPTGPYQLGGWCGGALVALEMAQQLLAAGEQVDLLVLMEPPVLHAEIRLFHAVLRWLGTRGRLSPEQQIDWFVGLQRVFELIVYRSLSYLYRHLRPPMRVRLGDAWPLILDMARRVRDVRPSAGRRIGLSKMAAAPVANQRSHCNGRPPEDFQRISGWLIAEYMVRPYSGKVIIFRSSRAHFEGLVPRRLEPIIVRRAAQAEHYVVPGDYYTCRTEHFHDVALQVQACMTQRRTGPQTHEV